MLNKVAIFYSKKKREQGENPNPSPCYKTQQHTQEHLTNQKIPAHWGLFSYASVYMLFKVISL